MSLNIGDQEYNSGKKYRQKGALCGPNSLIGLKRDKIAPNRCPFKSNL